MYGLNFRSFCLHRKNMFLCHPGPLKTSGAYHAEVGNSVSITLYDVTQSVALTQVTFLWDGSWLSLVIWKQYLKWGSLLLGFDWSDFVLSYHGQFTLRKYVLNCSKWLQSLEKVWTLFRDTGIPFWGFFWNFALLLTHWHVFVFLHIVVEELSHEATTSRNCSSINSDYVWSLSSLVRLDS